MTVVLDASAVLAFIAGEPGADVVEEALEGRPVRSAVNWSEVAQKVTAGGGDWSVAAALLTRLRADTAGRDRAGRRGRGGALAALLGSVARRPPQRRAGPPAWTRWP